MKKPWIWVVLLLSLGVNIGILAAIGVSRFKGPPLPEPAPWDGPRREQVQRRDFAPPIERMADALKLEGEIRDEFLGVQETFFRGMIEQRAGLERIRRELRSEVMTEKPDEARIDKLLEALGQAHADLDRLLVDNVLASRELLGPEQQQRYFHMLRRVREAMGEGGGRDRGRPGMESRRFGDRGPDGRGRRSLDPNQRRPSAGDREPPG